MLVINNQIDIEKYRLLSWKHQNRYLFEPGIWDAEAAPSAYFQSGIGFNNDVKLVGLTQDWKPILKSGHYFIRDNRFFLNSYDHETTQSFVLSFDSTCTGSYYIDTVEVDSYNKGYFGYNPVFLGSLKRDNDILLPHREYNQVRLFSHISDSALSGYVPIESVTGVTNTSTDLEFMINRVDDLQQTEVVTGEYNGVYYEEERNIPYTFKLALTDDSYISESVTETFDLKGSKVFCKLTYLPITSIDSVVVTYGGSDYNITSSVSGSFIPSGYTIKYDDPGKGILTFYNTNNVDDSWDIIYPSGTITVQYKTGLLLLYDNTNSETCIGDITMDPLTVGADSYNLLLTNTEIEPTKVDILTKLYRRCFVAGLPLEMKIRTTFNEAPILNYPVTVNAGLSQMTTNDLSLSNELLLRTDGDGYASCLYVPPKAVDDETFMFNLGHYVPVVDLGVFSATTVSGLSVYDSGVTNEFPHGVAYVGTPVDSYERNAVIFPTPKHAKSLLQSTLFSVHDSDRIRNNDFIGFLGVLRIKGRKKTVVTPARFTNQDSNSSYRMNVMKQIPAIPEDAFMSEFNYKFRTDKKAGITLSFRPYSTESNELLTYVNGRLIGKFTETVKKNQFHPVTVVYNLDYEYFTNEEHTFETDTIYLRHMPVSASGQGEFGVYDASGNAYTEGADYSITGNAITREALGAIAASGVVYINYMAESSYIYDDTVNLIRFVTTNPSYNVKDWDVADVDLNCNNALWGADNPYCPAQPLAFINIIEDRYLQIIPLDEISESTYVHGILYYTLPHSVDLYGNIIGYYVYTPGKDYVTAHATTLYDKDVYSSLVDVLIDVPDYMKGFFYTPEDFYVTKSPYSTINFFQVLGYEKI